MIKYTRSIQKVSDAIKDIFDTPGILIDTKAIVLVLAATMSLNKFNAFIDSIDKLSPIIARLKEINVLRLKYGDLFRDFIIIQTLHSLSHEISSDELQQFIREGKSPQPSQELSQALLLEHIDTEQDKQSIRGVIQRAATYLTAKFSADHQTDIGTIAEAYLHCRNQEKPMTAYYAVIYAMAEILETAGLDSKNSLLYSYKLSAHALKSFIHDINNNNEMLHAYKTIDNQSS